MKATQLHVLRSTMKGKATATLQLDFSHFMNGQESLSTLYQAIFSIHELRVFKAKWRDYFGDSVLLHRKGIEGFSNG
ncbi:MAG: hypothetical protein WBA12_14270 [Catalinimonas sp.]